MILLALHQDDRQQEHEHVECGAVQMLRVRPSLRQQHESREPVRPRRRRPYCWHRAGRCAGQSAHVPALRGAPAAAASRPSAWWAAPARQTHWQGKTARCRPARSTADPGWPPNQTPSSQWLAAQSRAGTSTTADNGDAEFQARIDQYRSRLMRGSKSLDQCRHRVRGRPCRQRARWRPPVPRCRRPDRTGASRPSGRRGPQNRSGRNTAAAGARPVVLHRRGSNCPGFDSSRSCGHGRALCLPGSGKSNRAGRQPQNPEGPRWPL